MFSKISKILGELTDKLEEPSNETENAHSDEAERSPEDAWFSDKDSSQDSTHSNSLEAENSAEDASNISGPLKNLGNALENVAENVKEHVENMSKSEGINAEASETEALNSTSDASATLPDIVAQLDADMHEVHAHIAASAENASLSLDDAQLGKMLSQTGAANMFLSLNDAGIESLDIAAHDTGSAIERTRSALEAGARAMVENDIVFPDSEYVPKLDYTGIDNELFENAVQAGPEQGATMMHEALHMQQYDYGQTHEFDHNNTQHAEASDDYDLGL